MQTVTPADVLAALSRRYREHYGDRLVAIYALPNDPYEPEEDSEVNAIDLVVVLRAPYDHFAETDPVVDIAHEVMDEVDWSIGVFPRHAAEDDELTEIARRQGVEI